MTRYTHRQENANHKEKGKNQLKQNPCLLHWQVDSSSEPSGKPYTAHSFLQQSWSDFPALETVQRTKIPAMKMKQNSPFFQVKCCFQRQFFKDIIFINLKNISIVLNKFCQFLKKKKSDSSNSETNIQLDEDTAMEAIPSETNNQINDQSSIIHL